MKGIYGDGWWISFSEEGFFWTGGGAKAADIIKMIDQEFPPETLELYESYRIAGDSRPMGSLYDDVLGFLKTWGIEAKAVGVGEPGAENAPS